MEDDRDRGPPQGPESLLPYEAWIEESRRHIVVRALAHVAAEGLPGEHHFYISFRTDRPGVVVPPRLLAQYPHEMTIVLQHQFWDLHVDEAEGWFSVGLSFGNVPSTLRVPLSAITAFADPYMQFGLQFHTPEEAPANDDPQTDATAPEASADPAPAAPAETPQVVSLDAFRRRPPAKD